MSEERAAFSKQMGPVYTASTVCTVTGLSASQLEEKRLALEVLSAVTVDGTTIYPVFQFEGAEVRSGITDLLSIFAPYAFDGWSLISWFTLRSAELGNLSPVEWVELHGADERVKSLAQEAAYRWSAV